MEILKRVQIFGIGMGDSRMIHRRNERFFHSWGVLDVDKSLTLYSPFFSAGV